MLNLLLGKDWIANRDRILQMIARDVSEEKGGRILMVPELISHDMERRLCHSAGDTSSRFAEVLSFTRLAKRVADSIGHAAEECLDNGGRIVAMASAARQIHSKLKAYASVESRPEFLTGLVDAVDEFKRCCITPEGLMAASKQTDGAFAQKLEELSLLHEAYDGLCQHGKRDPRDQMTWLLEQLEESTFGEGHVFYIDGFPDFTRQHMAILEHLIRVSPSVTISLNCDSPNTESVAFEKAADTASELLRTARRLGVEVSITTIDSQPDPLRPVKERIFQGKTDRLDLGDRLRVYQMETVYQECNAAAERVMDLVRGGARYRDIGIVCTDIAAYRNTLNMVFHRCSIPIYLSGTEDILEKPVIATVLAAMDAALGGFEQRDVFRYLRSILSPLELELCDRLENYAILWSINGNRWNKEWENHPSGLGETWSENDYRELEELNAARRYALEPLFELRSAFYEATNLAQQIEALYTFFERISLSDRLGQLADELDNKEDNRNAQILNQLWEILLTALEQMYDVLGQSVWDTESFTRLFKLLLSQYDVGTIPPVLDAVTAGPINSMRCHQSKHLLLLGALEGQLPGYGGSTGVLSDQERTALREMGVPLTGGAMEGLQAEFAEIYGVFCGAQESISVSCPSGQPSYVFRRLSSMAGGEADPGYGIGAAFADKTDAAAFLARWDGKGYAEELDLGSIYAEICDRRNHTLGRIGQENIRNLYGSRLNLSASQVDRQAECRLSYFLKYGLRAKERKAASIDPAEFGTYVHAVLEETVRKVMELGGFQKVSMSETLEIARGFSEDYARERFSQFDTERLTYLFRRNGQELEMIVQELWRELRESAFEPIDFEVAFGDQGKMPAIKIPSEHMEAQLRGFVDRVDGWKEAGQNFFRVVDYKTGKKDFDYCDIFNGLGLQMLLYLFALQQEGQELLGSNPVPAGVQYFPARVPLISSDGVLTEEEAAAERVKGWRRKGLLLLDDAVLQAMEPGDEPKRLSYTRKKDGTISGDLADREQLRLLREYVFKTLGKMVDEIASGCVDPNPYTRGSSHNACSFCPYGAICHKETVEGRRNYKAMSAQRFWDEVEKEMKKHG